MARTKCEGTTTKGFSNALAEKRLPLGTKGEKKRAILEIFILAPPRFDRYMSVTRPLHRGTQALGLMGSWAAIQPYTAI